ncbi:MAG: hypothetical protein KBH10_13585 [Laribacter sp.]|nr:hypothetical protein [Laribacter sp.]
MTKIVVNGNEYSDDGSSAKDMRNGGHRRFLLPMIGDCIADVDAIRAVASGHADRSGAEASRSDSAALAAQDAAAAAAGSAGQSAASAWRSEASAGLAADRAAAAEVSAVRADAEADRAQAEADRAALVGSIGPHDSNPRAHSMLRLTPEDLRVIDIDALPDNGLAFVLGVGLYRFDADSTLMPDGERVIAPTGVTGPGRWLLELPGLDMVLSVADLVAGDVEYGLLDRAGALDKRLDSVVKALDELGRKGKVQVFSRPFDVDFPSVPSLQSKSVAVQFAEARSGDAVIVNPPAAWADRLNLRAQVSAVGEVTLFAGNASASSFDPAVAQVVVTLLRRV